MTDSVPHVVRARPDWSGVAGSIAANAAMVSGSLSLLGFGADAVIDLIASIVLVWRFSVEAGQPHRAERVETAAERVETAAERVVGLALIALALYLAFGAARALIAEAHPESIFISLELLLASAVVLPPLAVALEPPDASSTVMTIPRARQGYLLPPSYPAFAAAIRLQALSVTSGPPCQTQARQRSSTD